MKPESMQMTYRLWDELNAFPASRTDDALVHLMHWFQAHMDVDNVIWLGSLLMLDKEAAKTDPLLGWRLRTRRSLVLESESYRKLVASYFANEHRGRLTAGFFRKGNGPDADLHIGMASQTTVRAAGTFRVYRMRDGWIDFEEFRQTAHFRLYYEEIDLADRIWVIVPVSPTVESIILLDRYGSKKRSHFTKADADLAGLTLRGASRFHRDLLLLHGVFKGIKPLSPIKLRLLRELLTGKSEKEIATATGHKPLTLSKYIKELYAEFGVRSRPALMAIWLGEP